MALGGWAALTLAAMPAASGVAWAADGQGHGATDGPPVQHQKSGGDAPEALRGDGLQGAGDRQDDGEHSGTGHPAVPERPAAGRPVTQPAAPVAAPAGGPAPATVPGDAARIEIGTALGPISGVSGAAGARMSASAEQLASSAHSAPLLSIDAPSPFAPRRISGDLRGARGALAVQVAIRRGAPGRGCAWWNARAARFTATRRGGCRAARWITGRVLPGPQGLRWRVELGGALPDGSYRYLARVVDAAGRPVAFDRV